MLNLRYFQELKAQHDVHNNTRIEAANTLEKCMQIVTVADEMVQRKFHLEFQEHWQRVSNSINGMQKAIVDNMSAPDVPINEKLALLEQELEDLKAALDNLHGIIKSEEELDLYIERLQIMANRVETIQNELGKLGMLSTTESEKVGRLLHMSKNIEIQTAEELEDSLLLRQRLQAIEKGLARVRKNHAKATETLDQCENAEKLGSDAVEKAVNDCCEVCAHITLFPLQH